MQKKWLKDIKTANEGNHTVKSINQFYLIIIRFFFFLLFLINFTITVLPRVLFEQWSAGDISSLNRDVQKKNQLISSLTDLAQVIIR